MKSTHVLCDTQQTGGDEYLLRKVLSSTFFSKKVTTKEELLIAMISFIDNLEDSTNIANKSASKRSHSRSWTYEDQRKRRLVMHNLATPILKTFLQDINKPITRSNINLLSDNLKIQLRSIQQRRKINVLFLGPQGSGKSSLIAALKGNRNPNCKRTIGFSPIQVNINGQTLTCYDLGGGQSLQNMWTNYFHDVHALAFVVDSSSLTEWNISLETFNTIISHKYMKGKPVLFIQNKSDLRLEIYNQLGNLHTLNRSEHQINVIQGIAHPQYTCNGLIDPRIVEGFDWLVKIVHRNFSSLQTRISSNASAEDKRMKIEKVCKFLQ